MARTRPGVERITRQVLVAQRTALTRQERSHMVSCHDCHRAKGDVYLMCPEWWAIARKLHKVNRALRDWGQDDDTAQDTLPGMDNL